MKKRGEPVAYSTSDDLERLRTGKTASVDVYGVPEAIAMYGDQPIALYAAPPVDPEKRERVRELVFVQENDELGWTPAEKDEAAALLREAYL